MNKLPPCPKCNSECVYEDGAMLVQQFPLYSPTLSQKPNLMFFYGNHFIAHKKAS
jgi:hypothetical protein